MYNLKFNLISIATWFIYLGSSLLTLPSIDSADAQMLTQNTSAPQVSYSPSQTRSETGTFSNTDLQKNTNSGQIQSGHQKTAQKDDGPDDKAMTQEPKSIRGLAHYLRIKQKTSQSQIPQDDPLLPTPEDPTSEVRKDSYHLQHLQSATELINKPVDPGQPAPQYRYIFLDSNNQGWKK